MTPPFTKAEMLNELRIIFLFEADHLHLGKGEAFAKTFVGFEPEDGWNYCNDDPGKVDLSEFPIANVFERGFDFAFAPQNPPQLAEDEIQDLTVFMLGTPKAGGTTDGGQLHAFMTSNGLCQRVADAAMARWKLEIARMFELSVREVALLAGMSEGAVRNAISTKDLVSIKQGKSTVIERDEAYRWLLGRKGFTAMPEEQADPSLTTNDLLEAKTPADFAEALRGVLAAAAGACEGLSWTEAERRRWLEGDAIHVFATAEELAGRLGIDKRKFVEKLLELGRPATK